jgi:hypothetical protein
VGIASLIEPPVAALAERAAEWKTPAPGKPAPGERAARRGAGIVSLLSLFAFAVHGYHPYAEDGGLYVAGIKKSLDPSLYPLHSEFVVAHLRFSPFASAVAAFTRATHLPLPWVLLGLYCASIWATLYAGWMIASRSVQTGAGRLGAVALLACWLTMPIAGTSLMLMDPYVTARSLSTPLALFALAWALDWLRGHRHAALLCVAALTLALIHPLMAGYAVAGVAVLAVVSARNARVRRWGPVVLAALALTTAACLQVFAPVESAGYLRAAMTRYYWFPLRWQWYEQFGAVAPLALVFALERSAVGAGQWKPLARTVLVLGAISLATALVFARADLSTHLVARLQPLRCFQTVYEILFLLLGAWLGERILRGQVWRWTLLLASLGGIMFVAQRDTYPASAHFELPTDAPRNDWVRAFVWARDNTPNDAVFAMDAHYITRAGEDAQGFRAIAERSVLPDYSKDGGETSITPALASAWVAGQRAQTNLDAQTDATRGTALRSLGVRWVVLESATTTAWPASTRTQPSRSAASRSNQLLPAGLVEVSSLVSTSDS